MPTTDASRSSPPADELATAEPPRRPMPAGHVLVVALVALAIGSLLNAKGMLKTASSQNLDSSRRPVALFFTHPLYDLSHFFHTDRPRAALQDLIGRSDDDQIAKIGGPSPTTTTVAPVAAGTTSTTAPAPVGFTRTNPLRVYVAGDSLAATPGQSIVTQAAQTGVITVLDPNVDYRISTGLSRPDVFDWPTHVLQVSQALGPHAVVLTFGANDDQSVQSPDGKIHRFGGDAWKAEYARRVGGLMDAVVAQGREVFWVGIPVVRDPARSARYELIDEIYAQQAALRPGKVFFVDTRLLFVDATGQYADYLPDGSGQLIRMRAADGIHFERAGGNRIAAAVIDAIRHTFVFG